MSAGSAGSRRRLRSAAYLALVIGLAGAIGLIAWRGFGTVGQAMAALGTDVFLLPFVYMPHIFGAAASWGLQFPEGRRPPFRVILRAIWTGIAVETLMPLGGIAAEVVKARLLIRSGTRAADAASLAVVDMTVQSTVLIFWAVIGFGALADTGPQETLFWPAIAGVAVLVVAAGLLFAAQRAGLFGGLARFGARMVRSPRWQTIAAGAAQVDRTVRTIYDRPMRIALSCAIRCATRGLMALEIWLAAGWMDHPISPSDAAMLIGIVGALRAAAFILPGGWGLQEGAYIVLGGMIGLPADMALALSLATRARELMLGVPALLFWQISEGRNLKVLAGQRSVIPLPR